jgi:hypothetical protein
VKSSNSKGKNNARHKKFKRPTSGGSFGVGECVGPPCIRMGEEQGNSIGVLDAMREDIRDNEGKTKCGKVKGRLW